MIQDLYERHFEELRRYCLQFCRNDEMASDLVQDTFMRALERADAMDLLAPQQQRAWLYRTSRNLFLDEARRGARLLQKQRYLLDEEAAEERGYSQAEMELLLLRLPPDMRAIFCLRYLDGYSAADLGEIFDMPAATVRTKLLRARQLLKKEMIV